ncbi:MAG: NAD(P)/FAD-dependent oxidoreductase [Leadbetterella sp.]
MENFDVLIVGGGAAGYFTAIQLAEKKASLRICILEKDKQSLKKVRVSGGGRCNVTNQEQDPQLLATNYPRGYDSLAEPFARFGSKETYEWFEKNGVKLKIEPDGRVFPVSNSSQTIIDLFESLCRKYKIDVFFQTKCLDFEIQENGFKVITNNHEFSSQYLVFGSGSDSHMVDLLQSKGLWMVDAVPSLFTFNIPDVALQQLTGTSFAKARVEILGLENKQIAPLLITHWGISGPAVLKMSAWAARELATKGYNFTVKIDFLPSFNENQKYDQFRKLSELNAKRSVLTMPLEGISQKFWKYICEKSSISEFQKWAETGKKQWKLLHENLSLAKYDVQGKSTFKEEFVTAGGVDLSEIDLNNFESKKYKNLYLAGEVLNIDGITGGFNFQAAWTGAWHIAESIASKQFISR